MYYALCIMYYVLRIMYYVLCNMYYVLYIMYYVLCITYYILCTMHYVLCIMYCIVYIMYYHISSKSHGGNVTTLGTISTLLLFVWQNVKKHGKKFGGGRVKSTFISFKWNGRLSINLRYTHLFNAHSIKPCRSSVHL